MPFFALCRRVSFGRLLWRVFRRGLRGCGFVVLVAICGGSFLLLAAAPAVAHTNGPKGTHQAEGTLRSGSVTGGASLPERSSSWVKSLPTTPTRYRLDPMNHPDPMDRTDPRTGATLCTAHNKAGELCGAVAKKGQKVCRIHGGASPQAEKAANRRLLEQLVGPALAKLRDIIDNHDTPPAVRLAAVRDILDRTGYGAIKQLEVVSIDAIDREIARLEAELALEDT